MKKLRTLFALLMTIALLMSFVACATTGTATTTESTEANSTSPEASAEPNAKADGGVTITFLCCNENYPESLKNCIARWEELTGNKVDVQLYSADEFSTVLTMQMSSGSGSIDLFRSDGTKYAESAWPLDYFYDLSNEDWVSRLTPEIKTLISFSDGTIRGLPYMTNTSLGMMYRKDIFEAAGCEVPKTWTEFLAVCQKIKDYGVTPVNIALASGSEFCTTHMMHCLFNNVYITRGVDGANQLFSDLEHNRVHYAEVPEYLTSLQQMYQLKELGYINDDFISNTYEQSIQRFGEGTVAMHPCGDFILEPLLASYPEVADQIGVFPVPYQDTIGSVPFFTGIGLHVASNAPHLQAALDFVSYYASYDNQVLYSADQPGLNLFSDVPASDNVFSKQISQYSDVTFTEIDETGVQTWPEMDARSYMQEMMLGEITPLEMLQKMDESAAITGQQLGIEGW